MPLTLDPVSFLTNRSGKRFPLRSGIPVFLEDADTTAKNQKYQKLYDRSLDSTTLNGVVRSLEARRT
jgi:hypothetical protein